MDEFGVLGTQRKEHFLLLGLHNVFMERREFTHHPDVHWILSGGDGAEDISNIGRVWLRAWGRKVPCMKMRRNDKLLGLAVWPCEGMGSHS